MTADRITTAARRLESTGKLLVLTGAGVSRESGIPTFRGAEGLWRSRRAEEMATPEAFERDPGLVWEWYRWRQRLIRKTEPNPAHRALAQLENLLPDFLLVTQNVDTLHGQAGSRMLIELHGNIFRTRCSRCGKKSLKPVPEGLPRCTCGGLVRPDVVWFGEKPDREDLENAFAYAGNCEMCLVVGTSGMVQPAATIPFIAKEHGAYIVDINPAPTPISRISDIAIAEPGGVVLPRILSLLVSVRAGRSTV